MKKLLLMMVVLALLVVPACVFADAAAPQYVSYEAYVSNPNGAPYYRSTDMVVGTLPFQSKITCFSYARDEQYVTFVKKEGTDEYYYTIKYEDITIEDLSQYELGNQEVILAINNAVIYDRPSINDLDKVDELTTIPNGTKLNAQKYISKDSMDGFQMSDWYYTSYEGKNGWIYQDNFAEKATSGILAKDITFELNGQQETIPMYTELEDIYRGLVSNEANTIEYGLYYLYNDFLIQMPFSYVAHSTNGYYKIKTQFEGISLYEQASLNSTVLMDSIPTGNTLVGNYIGDSMACVDYGGARGWIYVGNLPIYEGESQNRSIEEIKKDYFKSLEDAKIQALNDDATETVIVNPVGTPSTEPIENNSDITPNEIEPTEVFPNQPTNQTAPMSPMVIVVIALLGAGLCASIAIILILLVNKKK